jgi:hypothetical protein
MSRYRIPRNKEFPLSRKEKEILREVLEIIELDAYYPFKHEVGGFSEVRVWKNDDTTIWIVVKMGVEDSERKDTTEVTVTINREQMIEPDFSKNLEDGKIKIYMDDSDFFTN